MTCYYLPYTITLRAPLVMTSSAGDPNSSRTLSHIPGSAVRGAVASMFGDPTADPVEYELFRRLTLDGRVRFLNAYPSMHESRGLPMPLSLRMSKDAPSKPGEPVAVWDLAAFSGKSGGDDVGWPNAQLAEVPEPFVTLVSAQPLRVRPDRGVRIHQQRDRAQGRAWKDAATQRTHGTIFVFEFLEEGQEFDGFVQVFAENDAMLDELTKNIKERLRTPVLFGKSRRGGYGGDAAIKWRAPEPREVRGQGVINAGIPAGAEFRAVLTSAYIGRHPETGQLDPACFDAEVADRLGGRAEVIRRRWAFESIGGFNRKWRLQIPQTVACAAGSVLVLRARQRIPLDDLLAAEHDGLGERRVEGFGRLVFLGAPEREIVLRTPARGRASIPASVPPELVRQAEARIIDAALSRVIQEEAARLARGAIHLPSRSLLGRLRNAMRAEPAVAIQTMRRWLGEREGSGRTDAAHVLRRPAMDQLDRCRLTGRQQLSTWLRSMVNITSSTSSLKEQLRLDALVQRLHITPGDTAQQYLSTRETRLRASLIDATLAALLRVSKRRRLS
jgi:CRISPR-associated protein Csx10